MSVTTNGLNVQQAVARKRRIVDTSFVGLEDILCLIEKNNQDTAAKTGDQAGRTDGG